MAVLQSGDQPHSHAVGSGVLTRGLIVRIGWEESRSWLGHGDPLLTLGPQRLSLNPGAPVFAVGGDGGSCLPASGGLMVAPRCSLGPPHRPPRHLSAVSVLPAPKLLWGILSPCACRVALSQRSVTALGARGLGGAPKGTGCFPFPPSSWPPGARMEQ